MAHPKNNDEIANAFDYLTPKDYPIAYTARKWFFCGLQFYVTPDVLVPRVDTEVLVAEAAKCKPKTVLDLCTGSGCIAIALAKKLPECQITAADISPAALEVARKNASTHKVKIKFVQSDLFENLLPRPLRVHPFVPKGNHFDLIVCNPPYIKTAEIGKYDASILHEPRIALDGGTDGLDFYRQIIKDAPLKKIQVHALGFENRKNILRTTQQILRELLQEQLP